jgi:5-methyltetrahydropteroyltriglutamate--homocysteine methyltransferase
MKGFGGEGTRKPIQDISEFPEYADRAFPDIDVRVVKTPKAIQPLEYEGLSYARRERDDFLQLLKEEDVKFEENFITAASPGAISVILLNEYYDSHKDYVFALAKEMKKEYELLADSDLLLQLDCPDLAMERHWMFQDLNTEEFKGIVSLHVEAINRAVENIPKDKIRLHVCWVIMKGLTTTM